jgi:hypothetical protein
MQQIMEMLKTMLANNQEQILAKMDENRKTDKEEMNANTKTMLAEILKKAEVDRMAHTEQILAKMTAWEAKDKARREKKKAETEVIQAETEAIRARMDEYLKETTARIDAWLTDTNDTRVKTMACQENTEARLEGKEEPSSEDMKPEVANEEVPLDDAARMPVGEPRNSRRDRRHPAAQRRQKKQQKRTQTKNGRRRNLVAARRGTTRRAVVARRRRILFTKDTTREYRESRKVLAATSEEKTLRAGMAWCKGHNHEGPSIEQGRQKNQTRDKFAIGTRRLLTFRKSLWTRQEDRTRLKDLSSGSYVASRKLKRWTLRKGLPLRNESRSRK